MEFSSVCQLDHAGTRDWSKIYTFRGVPQQLRRTNKFIHCRRDGWCWHHISTKVKQLLVSQIWQPNREDFDCTCLDRWDRIYTFAVIYQLSWLCLYLCVVYLLLRGRTKWSVCSLPFGMDSPLFREAYWWLVAKYLHFES